MCMRDFIDDEQYVSRKKGLTDKIVILTQKVTQTQKRAHNWIQHTEEAFNYAHTAKARFDDPKTTLDEKKSIFTSLGWNYEVKDEKLFINQCKYLKPIAEKRKAVESEIRRLELQKTFALKKDKTPV